MIMYFYVLQVLNVWLGTTVQRAQQPPYLVMQAISPLQLEDGNVTPAQLGTIALVVFQPIR